MELSGLKRGYRKGGLRGAVGLGAPIGFVIVAMIAAPVWASADVTGQRATVVIPRVQRPPTLEDFLEMKPPAELVGKLAKVDKFTQMIPMYGAPISQRTEAYLGYDDKHTYVVFVCFDS
jgi:hypothetical protein